MPDAHRRHRLSRLRAGLIDGATIYVVHMNPPACTSIYDAADPRHRRLLTEVDMPRGVRARAD